MDETKIVLSVQSGNYDAFAELYDAYIDKIYRFIYHKTLHKETAEDLTSDTFMKALENLDKYSSFKGSFSTWLYTIARNKVIDHYRTKKEVSDIEDVWDLSSDEDIEHDIDVQVDFEKLQKVLKKIEPGHREILMMKFWQGMKYKEIADVIGKSEGSTKMLVSRLVKDLKKEFVLFFLFQFII